MRKIRRFLKSEDGVMVSTQALFLYPFTVFIIFWLIYMGLWMYQGVTLQNYAQKLAVTAAREVAYPGYTRMVESKTSASPVSIFGTSAIDWSRSTKIEMTNKASNVNIFYSGSGGSNVAVHPYRYMTTIGSDSNILSSTQKKSLQDIGMAMITENSMLANVKATKVDIKVSNYFVSQNVTVTMTEEVPVPGIVKWLGFDGNQITASASATANDPDEFVRDVDLVFDFADYLAKKLGISDKLDKAMEKVREVRTKLGI